MAYFKVMETRRQGPAGAKAALGVMVGLDCQPDWVESHLGDTPLDECVSESPSREV